MWQGRKTPPVMAGLDPATHQKDFETRERVISRAAARAMGGRVKPGHDKCVLMLILSIMRTQLHTSDAGL
jgi:hypothetical protein